MKSAPCLKHIIVLTSNVAKSTSFYREALGVPVLSQTDNMAELSLGPTNLVLKETYNVSTLCTGYSPILSLQIVDMESVVTKAISLGATLDGPIRYPAHGKFASLKTPDGNMVGLFESPA